MIAASAAAISLSAFRYERTLRAARSAVVVLVPDGRMYEHAHADFSDVRVVDARGAQVPWRLETTAAPETRTLPLFDLGRRGSLEVARVRLRVPAERLSLRIADRRFVTVATVYGSDDERAWTRVAAMQIYAVGGAHPARSTTVLLPRNDFRWLEVRAAHVRIRTITVTTRGLVGTFDRIAVSRASTADLGWRRPVDELRITASTHRYNRPFVVRANGVVVAHGRLVRTGGATQTVVPLDGLRTRRLRVVVANGDDPPLQGMRVSAFAHPRRLLLEGKHPTPLTVYYGAATTAPDYDWARLPLPPDRTPGRLGVEYANPQFRLVDRRGFFAKHRSLVTVALGLAAALLVAAGAFALRKT
jgi:hypothetical protein